MPDRWQRRPRAPSKGASASTARRRTAGLSLHAAMIEPRPRSSPIAPSAATADSRTSGSSATPANSTRRSTISSRGDSCSPHAQAATSTTRSSGSSRLASRSTARCAADDLCRASPHPGIRRHSTRLRGCRPPACASRSKAPSAADRTAGSAEARPDACGLGVAGVAGDDDRSEVGFVHCFNRSVRVMTSQPVAERHDDGEDGADDHGQRRPGDRSPQSAQRPPAACTATSWSPRSGPAPMAAGESAHRVGFGRWLWHSCASPPGRARVSRVRPSRQPEW